MSFYIVSITVFYKVISSIEGIDHVKWDAFNSRHPDYSVFQSPLMCNYYSSLTNAEPVLIAVLQENDEPAGILLGVHYHEFKKLPGFLSSWIVIYGGPLIDPVCTDKEVVLSLLLEELVNKWGKVSFFIQFRNFYNTLDFSGVFRKYGFSFYDHLNLVVDTSRQENIQTGISRSKLRQVRKSMEAGAFVEPAQSMEEVREFYKILSSLYTKKVKKPHPSLQFFEEFYSFSKSHGLGIILLAKTGTTIIGGMVCPITPGKRMFEWYVCGLDREYRQLYPSVLVTYSAISYAAGHSIPVFDFMGMGKPDQKYGVREFKSRFGGTVANNGRYLRFSNKVLYRFAEAGYRVLSFLKIV
jgi:hypothetical protein